MREQPHALRLAKDLEMCAEIDFDHIFVPAAAALRTQHALLERALDALEYHVAQTRPIQTTSEAIEDLRAYLEQQQ